MLLSRSVSHLPDLDEPTRFAGGYLAYAALMTAHIVRKIVGSQYNGSRAFSSKNLRDARSSNYCTQPHELIYTLIWPHITPAFKTVHRRCADRARNYFALIEHCKLNDGPIEVVTLDVALLQQHCKCSIWKDLILPRQWTDVSLTRLRT